MNLFVQNPKRPLLLVLLLAVFGSGLAATVGAEPFLPSGEPDPTNPSLRLWLRADSGIKDGQGRGPADGGFDGRVVEWIDRSAHHYDLKATPPERAPLYVPRQTAASNQPVVAFAGRQILSRIKDPLHDQAESTTVIVLQQQARSGGYVYSIGQGGNTRELLNLPSANPLVSCPTAQSWLVCTAAGERGLDLALPVAGDSRADGKRPKRFRKEIVAGQPLPGDGGSEGRLRICWLNCGQRISSEHHDGTGNFLGGVSAQAPPDMKPGSNKCLPEFTLGGMNANEPQFSGQIAEMLVFNRVLSAAEKQGLLVYLRARYGLNAIDSFFPTDAFLLSLGDFVGPWGIGGGGLTGRLAAAGPPVSLEPMKMTVEIPHDGAYFVWVRATENARGQQGNFTTLQTTVQGHELDVTHAVGPGGVHWRLAGKPELKKGPAEIMIRGVGPGNKSCEAVLISPSAISADGVEESVALAQRLRQTGGSTKFIARFTNGLRLEGNPLVGWRWSDAAGNPAQPDPNNLPVLLCVQFDSPRVEPDGNVEMSIEFHNGDCLRGRIVDFQSAASQPVQPATAQLIVRTQPIYVSKPEETFSIGVDWVRRIVLDKSRSRNCQPQSLICRDGRTVVFRSIRWGAESIRLLTEDGVEQLWLRDVAEICLAEADPWQSYFRELSFIDPTGTSTIVQIEALDGTQLTASQNRISQDISGRRTIQPAWCRTPVTLPPQITRVIWQAPAHVVPLSRLWPTAVVQRGALGNSWKWQANRNVAGDVLRSGSHEYLWGYGVHAPNEMAFLLPECAQSFRSSVGIDGSTGTAGKAVARIYLNESKANPLYQSGLLTGGSKPVDTGTINLPPSPGQSRKLVLVTDTNHDAGRQSQDVLDIGAHIDWLEPILLLSPELLQAEVAKAAATPAQ